MIICLGTTPNFARTMTFEAVRLDDVNRAVGVTDYASGKGVNAARVLTTLGERAVATGFLGGDRAAAMRRDMDSAGIGNSFVDVASPTRMCVTVLDRSASTATELIEEAGPVTDAEVATLLDHLAELLLGASLLVVSGSLATGVASDFYRDSILLATRRGVRTIVDAAGAPLELALPAKPFLVKPNRSELARTLGRTIETDDQLRGGIKDLIAAGPTWAVVTLGREGAIVSDGREFWRIAVPTITPVSAIGSGDSFAAGLAAGLARGRSVPEAARLAAACGVANALTDRAGHLSREIVDRVLSEVRFL